MQDLRYALRTLMRQPGFAAVAIFTVRRGALLAGFGVAIGTAGGLAATRALTTLLYEIRPGDPATYLEIGAILVTAARAACYLPARRAAQVDPAGAVRSE